MDELTLVETYLVGVLTGDSTLSGLVAGIHTGVVEESGSPESAYPCVLIAYYPGGDGDALGNGPHRVLTSAQYVIRVLDRDTESFVGLSPAAARLDELLKETDGVLVEGGQRWEIGCYRIRPVREGYVDEGISYRAIGGVYQTEIAPIGV